MLVATSRRVRRAFEGGLGRKRVRLGAYLAIPLLLAVCLVAASCGGVDSGSAQPPTDPGSVASGEAPSSKTPQPEKTKTSSSTRKTGTAKIVFVNVGQGDAAIIKSGSWAGLIDGGPSGSEGAIESALRKLGVSRLSAVVVTHPHADHTGGLSRRRLRLPPEAGLRGRGGGQRRRRPCAASGRASPRCAAARRSASGRCAPRCSAPARSPATPTRTASSCCSRPAARRFLFTGDCTGRERVARRQHLRPRPAALPAQGGAPRLALLDLVELPRRDRPEVRRHQRRPQLLRAPHAGDDLRPQGGGHAHLLDAEERHRHAHRRRLGSVSWAFAKSSKPVTSAGSSSQAAEAAAAAAPPAARGGSGEGLHHRDRRVLPPRRLPLPLAQQDPHLTEGRQGTGLPPLQRLRSANVAIPPSRLTGHRFGDFTHMHRTSGQMRGHVPCRSTCKGDNGAVCRHSESDADAFLLAQASLCFRDDYAVHKRDHNAAAVVVPVHIHLHRAATDLAFRPRRAATREGVYLVHAHAVLYL